ncbi:LnmK family bifunctional acyltransferase/decarboxylase [Salinispora pacifica]|uniref:Lom62 n=1 Tax=Salinispora pacifica TaxID=351187 RepID=A0A059UHK4_SALPI|nr:LnmK family bifunctional acyltransferase/decarboxylase [Salinispora pacifica]AHZ61896.1 Lom62 [Salinispora pacifica]
MATYQPAPFTQVGRPALVRGPGDWWERVELITPAMCGPNSLFVGQLGDWTWDAVGAACHLDPYSAVDPAGNPVYLSFAYFRVQACRELSVEQLTFGDRLRVRSKVFSCGGDSVLTVHQVSRHDGVSGTALSGDTAGTDDFFSYDTPGCLHVETFNRWIQRSGAGTNHGLRRATPVGFRIDHLEQIADEYTPRRIMSNVRRAAGFRSVGEPPPQVRVTLTYQVSASRDLNGVGLLYFASYFSIVDWAVLQLWRSLGRSVAGFLRRRVLDRQVCLVANANADDVLDVEVTMYRDASGEEVVDVSLRRGQDDSLLAVARQRITPPAN